MPRRVLRNWRLSAAVVVRSCQNHCGGTLNDTVELVAAERAKSTFAGRSCTQVLCFEGMTGPVVPILLLTIIVE